MSTFTFTRTDNRIVINDYTDDQPDPYKIEVDTLNNKVTISNYDRKWYIDLNADTVVINDEEFAGTAAALKTELYASVFKDNKGTGSGGVESVTGLLVTGTAADRVVGASYLVFDTVGDFPATGSVNILYGALDTGVVYTWNPVDEVYFAKSSGLESYQNAAMSSPVLAYVFRNEDNDIVRVFEPSRKNDITALTGSEADSLEAFPFDNTDWHGVTSRGGKFLSKHSGSYVKETVLEIEATINFNGKIDSRINKSSIGQFSTLLFGADNAEEVIELTMLPTSFIVCGGAIEAVTLNAGASVRGDSNEFFTSVSNSIFGNNSQTKPGTTNTFGIDKSTFGNKGIVTLGGNADGITVMDNVTMTTAGAKTNAQFLNIGGTSYQIGEDTGAATLTPV